MIFWLSGALDVLEAGVSELDPQVVAIDNFGQAGYVGDHLVLGPRDQLAEIGKSQKLSPRARAYFTRTSHRLTELGGRIDLSHHVQVDAECNAPVFRGGTWHVPLRWFAEPATVGRAILLGEDDTDCAVLEAFSEIAAGAVLPGCVVSLRWAAGGGANTARRLAREARDGFEVGCCVVDSDRKSPRGSIGNTAALCRDEYRPYENEWRWKLIILPVRELENLLPIQLMGELAHQDAELQRRIENLPALSESISSYLDLKSGESPCRFHDADMSWVDWMEIRDGIRNSHRHPDFSQCVAGCADTPCAVTPNLGGRALARVSVLLKDRRVRRMCADTSGWRRELRDIAEKLAMLGAASPRMS